MKFRIEVEGTFVRFREKRPGDCVVELVDGDSYRWSWERDQDIPEDYISIFSDRYCFAKLPEHIKPYKNRFPHNGLVTLYPTRKGWSIEQDKLVVGHCETFPDMQIKSVWIRHGLPQVSGWLN